MRLNLENQHYIVLELVEVTYEDFVNLLENEKTKSKYLLPYILVTIY